MAVAVQRPQVFISYQRADEAFARRVREHLVAHNVQTWMDQYDIQVGAYWPDEIDRGLSLSDMVVGILSPDAVESRNVKNEWDWAIQHDKRLVLLQVRSCDIPHRYVSINFIDATGADHVPPLDALLQTLGIVAKACEPAVSASPIATRHTGRSAVVRRRVEAVIVGREREQSLLNQRLEELAAGHGSVVLIGGEAGIGKTTLTNWLAWAAQEQDALVLTGGCYDLTTAPPYGPWIEVTRSWPDSAGGLPPLPDELREGTGMGNLHSQAALFERITDLLEAASAAHPLVLVLDDLHWADQGSLDFFRFLARQISSLRILLVATYRSDELHRHHPLYTLLPLVIREAGAERLEVRRLDAEGHRSLIASRYSMSEEDAVRLEHHLQAHAEGNPLFALELLRSLEEEGILQQSDRVWSIGDIDRVRVPPLLRQVIERRLVRLGDEVRSLLQVAAIIGQEVSLDLWQQVTEATDEALVTAIEQGQATHLLEEVAGGASYRFQHALLREALYESVVSLRRRGWHRKMAEALAARPKPVPDTVAHHFQQAGDVRAVAWLLESGRRARMTYATATAIERLETALALDEQHDGASGLRGWLLAGLAGLGELFARVDERVSMLDEAMDIAQETRDEPLVALAEWYRAFLETNYSASVIERLGSARDRIQTLPPDERERLFGFIYGAVGGALDPSGPEVTCLVIGFQAQSGQYRAALAAVDRVRMEHPKLSASAELGIDNALMASYQALGRPEDALQHYDRVLAAHRRDRASDWAAVMRWLKLRDLVLVYWPDRIGMRRAVADESVAAVQLAKAEQTFHADMPDEVGIAWLLLVEGRWDEARRLCEMATADWVASYQTAAPWMVLSRQQGSPDAGLARLPLVFPDGPASQPGRQTFETSVYCMHAAIEIALDAGDLESARAWLECHDRWIAWSGHIPFTTVGHLLSARYHRVSGDLATAMERASEALTLASEPRQPLTLLAAHRLHGELGTEGGTHDDAQQHLAEALWLADACQAPFERALTLLAMAELAASRGNRDLANQHISAVRAICEPLKALPTLAHVDALEKRLAAS